MQTINGQDIFWIIETKGREFEETTSKDKHMTRWCEEVSRETGNDWRYLKVQQTVFEDYYRRGNIRSFTKLCGWSGTQGFLFGQKQHE